MNPNGKWNWYSIEKGRRGSSPIPSSKPLLNVVRFERQSGGIEKGSTQPRAVSDRLLRTPDLTRFWDLRNAKEERGKRTCVSEHLLAEMFFYLIARQVVTIQ